MKNLAFFWAILAVSIGLAQDTILLKFMGPIIATFAESAAATHH